MVSDEAEEQTQHETDFENRSHGAEYGKESRAYEGRSIHQVDYGVLCGRSASTKTASCAECCDWKTVIAQIASGFFESDSQEPRWRHAGWFHFKHHQLNGRCSGSKCIG